MNGLLLCLETEFDLNYCNVARLRVNVYPSDSLG